MQVRRIGVNHQAFPRQKGEWLAAMREARRAKETYRSKCLAPDKVLHPCKTTVWKGVAGLQEARRLPGSSSMVPISRVADHQEV